MTGKEYRKLRESRGWSQRELAIRLGVDQNTVARRERGESPIDDETAHAVRRVVEMEEGSE